MEESQLNQNGIYYLIICIQKIDDEANIVHFFNSSQLQEETSVTELNKEVFDQLFIHCKYSSNYYMVIKLEEVNGSSVIIQRILPSGIPYKKPIKFSTQKFLTQFSIDSEIKRPS